MTKIEELIESIRTKNSDYGTQDFHDYQIELIMQEYAEYYAKKCLEMLDSEAEYTDQNCYCDSWVLPDKPSNYKLIEHE